ncbi:MAG: hypothetical protein IJ094_12930 [Bacilli bacterium]|nr:hypothetical protein [Bacilli bacterium]
MSRESELQAEIDAKTKEFERIRNEKEKAEEEMRIHVQNTDLASKIEYIQYTLKSIDDDYFKENGWSFSFGRIGYTDKSFIQFKNDWNIEIPDSPELFADLVKVIIDILEKKKISLRES